MLPDVQKDHHTRWIFKPSCITISIITMVTFFAALLLLLDHRFENFDNKKWKLISRANTYRDNMCRISLIESIPEGLNYSKTSITFPSTYNSWMNLIDMANDTIDIASFYWTLRLNEVYEHPSSQQGEEIYQAIKQAGTERNIRVRIAQNMPDSRSGPNIDTEALMSEHAAEVKNLNFTKMFDAGVLHTKFWIIDKKHIYVGSANMDWRSLTQVKEMGLVAYNCPCLASDLSKIFEVYWLVGEKNSNIPPDWPASLSTQYNMITPMNTILNNTPYKTYISSSPPAMSTVGRSGDIDSILNIISNAEKFVYISVMDYIPLEIYTPKQKFWPIIDDALRKVALEKNIKVYLLISRWMHSKPTIDFFLRSLTDLSGIRHMNRTVDIQVKRFVVPTLPDQVGIPYARVNHNKYMVTDNTLYIGTSNWSGDYFINTAGVGFVIQEIEENLVNVTLRQQLINVFERDWNSEYAKPLIN